MAVREIKTDVFAVGAIDWDRTIFDALIPLPHGTTYNSYLIKGSEKTALIDAVEPEKFYQLKNNLEKAEVHSLDYIISNHAEQDHSGSIPHLLEIFPEAKVVTNGKCKDMLMKLLHLPEEVFYLIDNGETLSLGRKTLEFISAPWVHWPETMFTYLREDKLLFSCDFMGSHYATSDLYAADKARVYQEAKRYYAEIMMPFAKSIRKHLQNLEKYDIDMVAPSHGPVYDDPGFMFDAYAEWVSDSVKNEVVILYITMHGSTEKMAGYLTDALIEKGVSVKPFNLVSADIGEIALGLVDAATVVLASPAVLMGPHPNIIYAAYLANTLKPKTKFASVIGSFGWGNKMVDQITGQMSNLKIEILPPVLAKGLPSKEDYRSIDRLADNIIEKHQDLGLF